MNSFADRHNVGASLKPVFGNLPQNASAGNIEGAAIDRMGFDSCKLAACAGAASGTPTAQSYDAKLQESADGSTGWTDITDAAVTQIDADDTQEHVDVDLTGCKQYIRVYGVVAFTGGTTPALPVAAVVELGGPHKRPTA